MDEQATQAYWYVVHTYSGYENKVAKDLETMVKNRRLQDLIQEVKVPTEMVPELKDGKERLVERKVFPGYVLVKMVMTDDTWYVVRNVRGCTGFVGPAGEKPIPLSQAEVDRLGVENTAELTVSYKEGDIVRIRTGSMTGSVGKVASLNKEARQVTVLITMFGGRETPTTLSLDQVELI
ncbi:MAG: transcription termination/antitermination factor NusG [Oscillospiraceae bacterium]|nr:transcription termination/antitermination factor NusG [Oscillospiraceae bacterium]